ncbi:GNAT family N-acetyltransferase [Motilibacter aurantiacus]|uniref:GNAT family N-acetyltransferase n=1 Tax=Motilibacter aurantiacus TaxID=2714955 RepID=UPI00140A966A|nr:GNAT family N-acetyltransferase [Motilibacter aurantiacus]NHC47118.1 GNAT family N-acetyltransferase [Motilibacter aurantiacus]
MAFLPRDFRLPLPVEHERFTLRHITVHDVIRDYDAVMSSRERLWAQFGEVWGWPAEGLTIEQDLIDLAWHQKEGDLRRAFNLALLSPDGSQLLGCVYVDPPEKAGADADVAFWVRASEAGTGLEAELEAFVRRWLAEEWPFGTVRYPGRDLTWAEWEALPDR